MNIIILKEIKKLINDNEISLSLTKSGFGIKQNSKVSLIDNIRDKEKINIESLNSQIDYNMSNIMTVLKVFLIDKKDFDYNKAKIIASESFDEDCNNDEYIELIVSIVDLLISNRTSSLSDTINVLSSMSNSLIDTNYRIIENLGEEKYRSILFSMRIENVEGDLKTQTLEMSKGDMELLISELNKIIKECSEEYE